VYGLAAQRWLFAGAGGVGTGWSHAHG
jgi:hypothetical protein